jgi:integrase
MDFQMTGSLKKRSEGSWSIVLYLGRDLVTGKKRQKWQTYRGNKKGAQAELARLLHELNTGAYIEPVKLTVGDFLEKWLDDYAKVNVGGKTFERYVGIVRQHLIPALGSILLTRLQPLHIQTCYSKSLECGRKDGRPGGLSPQTVVHHHRVLREALKQAVRWQLLPRNAADAVQPPKAQYHEVNALDEARTAWLFDAAAGTRLHIPILLAITTGMRRGEILAVRWRDLDLDARLATVQRSLQETKGGLVFKPPKSHRSRRPIELPTITVELLKEHRESQENLKRDLGSDYHDGDLVCCREDGKTWRPSAFTSSYRALLKRRKVDNIRFHDLRHSHASQLFRDKVNAKVISERLGHSKVAFTLDVYSHLLPGMQNEAAVKTDERLRAALEKQRRPIS